MQEPYGLLSEQRSKTLLHMETQVRACCFTDVKTFKDFRPVPEEHARLSRWMETALYGGSETVCLGTLE